MKAFIFAAVGFLAAAVSAQDLSTLPQCAQSCAISAIGSTGCSVTDAHCICSASTFLSGVATCISTACSAADQQATLTFAQQYCLSGGVTITLPGAASSAPPASSSAAPSTAAATTQAASTSAAGSATSSKPAAATFTGAAAVNNRDQAVGLLGVVVGLMAAL